MTVVKRSVGAVRHAYPASPGIVDVARMLWDFLYALSDVLRRCLLPVLFVAVLAALLYLPQSAEFFASVLQVCDVGAFGCRREFGVQANAVHFIVFELLMLGFSLCVWYAARTLASYRRPVVRERKRYTRLLQIWVPRVAGAVPLYLSSLVMLGPLAESASRPQLAAGLAFVGLLLLTPLMLRRRFSSMFSRRKMWWGLTVGALSVMFCSIQPLETHDVAWFVGSCGGVLVCYLIFVWQIEGLRLYRAAGMVLIELLTAYAFNGIGIASVSATPLQTWTWTVTVAMMLPSLYLMFVMFRHPAGMRRQGRHACRAIDKELRFSRLASRLVPQLPWRSVLLWLLAFGAVAAAAVLAALWPERAARLLFAPAALVLWLTLLLLATFGVLFIISLVLRFMLAAAVLLLILAPSVPPMAQRAPAALLPDGLCNDSAGICSPSQTVARQFEAWQALHGGAADREPIILVSSAGGGSRAAAHTASMLAKVDAATCGVFGDRIFAISAVSGGALGAAAYVASRHDLPRTVAERAACPGSPAQRAEQMNRLAVPLMTMTARDHLSPMLIRGLFRDLPASLVPPPLRPSDWGWGSDYFSRAGALAASWRTGYHDLLRRANYPAQTPEHFTSDLGSSPGAVDGSEPLLLLNAASAQDGRRVVMSRPLFCPLDGYCAAKPENLLANAIDSARFPLISPARNRDVYGWDAWQKTRMRVRRSLVDGGYADNSGTVTLLDVVEGLYEHGVDLGRVRVILITSNPDEGLPLEQVADYAATGLLAQLQAPLNTVIHARDGRTDGALQALRKRLSENQILYWPMTTATLNHLTPREAEQAAARRAPEVLAEQSLRGVSDTSRRHGHAAPLGWALSPEAAYWADSYAAQAYVAYAYPDHEHPFDYETDLIRQLHAGHGAAVKP
jgi:hypothetical protein